MDKANNVIERIGAGIMLVVILVLLSACEHTDGFSPPPPPEEIVIYFTGGCATGVNNDLLPVGFADQVRWQSEPTGMRYKIWFDPFRGRPIISNGQGRTAPKNLDPDIPHGETVGGNPYVEYKYTIQSLDNHNDPNPDCKPVDPHIRVG